MPGLSTTVKVSGDGQYIMATGIYKPRIKCFDVNNLSLKFERCFDSECITFEILSDDYSKVQICISCKEYDFTVCVYRLYSYSVIGILNFILHKDVTID